MSVNGSSKLLSRHDAPAGPNELGRSIGPLLNLAKPRACNSHLISIEQVDVGTAEFAAFETKLSRIEFKDRATIRGVSRGQRREQRQRRLDSPLNWTYESVDPRLLDKRLLTRINAAKASA
jgi:hypothetical protein